MAVSRTTMVMALLLSQLATFTSAAAPIATPPGPTPVCSGEGIPGIDLIRNEIAFYNFNQFLINNALKYYLGTYNPIYHGRLIDCGCGKIIDTRSFEEMAKILSIFCERKEFQSFFEDYARYVIFMSGQPQLRFS